ncbi:MAG: transcription antitermination factor NusB [Eubacterium sp.]|jgi:transcription antitermination factor nusB|nr:transcription antitermination factor NusB [Lachnospiraceae bacterium NSJ-171]MEE0293835.1 transcription antitermination factor NusB [Eubacterium sp.]
MNRTEIRENTFKLLFCKEFHSKEDMGEQYKLYMESLEDEEREKTNKIISEDSVEELIPFEDKEYIVERVNKIIDAIPEIDKAIDEVAVGWKTDRMGKVELSILRLAYYEMAMDDDVPGKVAVDQAVILAKKYGSDNSPAFINGILAKLFQE